MTEACPYPSVAHKDLSELWDFRQLSSQKLVDQTEAAASILAKAEDDLTEYYKPVLEANPVFGELQVSRTLRDIALSAALHIGATVATNRILPDIHKHVYGPDRSSPFPLEDHVRPLARLEYTSARSEPCDRFLRQMGGVLLEWSEIGIADPSEAVRALARAVKGLHKRFERAEVQLGIYQTTQDPDQFISKLKEDNSEILLGMLLGKAILLLGGNPEIDPHDIAINAINEQQDAIRDIASTSRRFFQTHVWQDGRVIRTYEDALLSDAPHVMSVTASHFRNINGETISPLPSLAYGAWRNPRMCVAFPRLGTYPKSVIYQEVTRALYNMAGVFDPVITIVGLAGKTKFSTIEMGLNFGVLAAHSTIYQHQPQVVLDLAS